MIYLYTTKIFFQIVILPKKWSFYHFSCWINIWYIDGCLPFAIIIYWFCCAIIYNYIIPILHIRKTAYRQNHCVIVLNFTMFCQTISIFLKNINSCFKLRKICCCAQLGTEFVCSLAGILKYHKYFITNKNISMKDLGIAKQKLHSYLAGVIMQWKKQH